MSCDVSTYRIHILRDEFSDEVGSGNTGLCRLDHTAVACGDKKKWQDQYCRVAHSAHEWTSKSGTLETSQSFLSRAISELENASSTIWDPDYTFNCHSKIPIGLRVLPRLLKTSLSAESLRLLF